MMVNQVPHIQMIDHQNHHQIEDKTKDKLILASERHSTKFHRYLLTESLKGKIHYSFTPQELYSYYLCYVDDYGTKSYDRSYVETNFELHLKMNKQAGRYALTESQRVKMLAAL